MTKVRGINQFHLLLSSSYANRKKYHLEIARCCIFHSPRQQQLNAYVVYISHGLVMLIIREGQESIDSEPSATGNTCIQQEGVRE